VRAAAVTFIAATVIVALYFGREVLIPVAIAVLSDKGSAEAMERSVTIRLICYASHPSEAVRRYTLRKLSLGGGARQARYLVIDYDVAPAPAPSIPGATGAADTFAGDVAPLCRLVGQHAVAVDRHLASA
jgi:hypothetical protein